MKKKIYGVLLVLCLLIFSNISVQAANPKTVTLKEGKTYTQYDITGDKKADKFKITVKRASNSDCILGFQISVNGKIVYKEKDIGLYTWGLETKLFTIKDKPFLYVVQIGDNDMTPYSRIFQYKDKKMKSIVDLAKRYQKSPFICPPYRVAVENIKSSDDKIIVRYRGANFALALIRWNAVYQYKKGILVNTSNTNNLLYLKNMPPTTNKWKVARTMKVYKNKSVDSELAFVMYEGDVVRITKMYCKGMNTWFFVQKGSRSGWMKSPTKKPAYEDYYFDGVFYGG